MSKEIISQTKEKMEKTISILSRNLASIRAGRASASILDKVTMDYYGASTPVNQLASIAIPEPRMIVIQPYDPSTLGEIEKAILKSDLGINPTNDGNVIRLVMPILTEERRKELVKQVKREAEDSKVVIRNIRRDANDELKKLEKSGEISEDALKGFGNDVQKLTDDFVAKIDQAVKVKEKELLEV